MTVLAMCERVGDVMIRGSEEYHFKFRSDTPLIHSDTFTVFYQHFHMLQYPYIGH